MITLEKQCLCGNVGFLYPQ